MIKRTWFVIASLVAASSATITNVAYADACAALSGQTFCGKFKYSNTGKNFYTVVFNADGTFNLGGNSPGTYSCPGRGFLETDYKFGGFEDQQWLGSAGLLKGYGKSITNGYLYSFALTPGACPAAARTAAKRQDQ